MPKQTVKFTNGPLHGALVEIPEGVTPNPTRWSVTPAGALYDRDAQRVVPGSRVLQGPHPREVPPTKPARRRRANTSA